MNQISCNRNRNFPLVVLSFSLTILFLTESVSAEEKTEKSKSRIYQNKLTKIENPAPLLNDYPEYVQPVREKNRFRAPALINEKEATLEVRSWRFSYNARGIIEMPNFLRGDRTAVIVVHPWGIDDGQGWRTPEPAGVCDMCTPEKNDYAGKHINDVMNPLLKRLRPHVSLTMYSLRSYEQPVHKKLYRSFRHNPSKKEREQGKRDLKQILNRFNYKGKDIPTEITISEGSTFQDYFRNFPGLDASAKYNNDGFWSLPVPVHSGFKMAHDDVVIYDDDGYPPLRAFLKKNGIKHIILTGYATDMCFCLTTAGYQNLSKDFNVFLVGDATLATFPANDTPAYATNAHISFASLNQMITQCSWIKVTGKDKKKQVSR